MGEADRAPYCYANKLMKSRHRAGMPNVWLLGIIQLVRISAVTSVSSNGLGSNISLFEKKIEKGCRRLQNKMAAVTLAFLSLSLMDHATVHF